MGTRERGFSGESFPSHAAGGCFPWCKDAHVTRIVLPSCTGGKKQHGEMPLQERVGRISVSLQQKPPQGCLGCGHMLFLLALPLFLIFIPVFLRLSAQPGVPPEAQRGDVW